MPSIFEQLMTQNRQLTESTVRSRKVTKSVSESKKISASKIKLESLRIFEDADLDELDTQFAVDPEDSEESEVVLVVDPELPADEEVPEDAAENMVGDEVYKCPVCGANYVCDCEGEKNESIEVDENGVPTECPICGDDAEQILVGEIAPADGAGEEIEEEPVDVEDAEDEEEVLDEIPEEEEVVEDEGEDEFEESVKRGPQSKLKEGKTYSFLDSDFNFKTDENPETVKSEYGVDMVKVPADKVPYNTPYVTWCVTGTADQLDNLYGSRDNWDYLVKDEDKFEESVDFDNEEVDADIDADDGSLVLDTDTVTPPTETPSVAIDADTVNLTIDETKLESMMTSMLRENYKFNPSFKVTKATYKGKSLRLEYVVRQKGHGPLKGTLVVEGFVPTARKMTLKAKDKGVFTESFSKTPSFMIECIRIKNTVIPTALSYDFKKKVNESVYRVVGQSGRHNK